MMRLSHPRPAAALLPLLALVLASCAQDEALRKRELAEISENHSHDLAQFEAAQAEFARTYPAPSRLDFPGAGTILIHECALGGRPGKGELWLRYTYVNTTGRPIEEIRVEVRIQDPTNAEAAAADMPLKLPLSFRFTPDSSYTTSISLPTEGAHEHAGWSWGIRPVVVGGARRAEGSARVRASPLAEAFATPRPGIPVRGSVSRVDVSSDPDAAIRESPCPGARLIPRHVAHADGGLNPATCEETTARPAAGAYRAAAASAGCHAAIRAEESGGQQFSNGYNASMSAVLKALQTPRRREILRLVWDDERSAGEIHRSFEDVTFGAVSQHLRVLSEAGLVTQRKDGRHRYYLARKAAVGKLRPWLEEQWDSALARLQVEAEIEAARRGPRSAGSSAASPTPKKRSRR